MIHDTAAFGIAMITGAFAVPAALITLAWLLDVMDDIITWLLRER